MPLDDSTRQVAHRGLDQALDRETDDTLAMSIVLLVNSKGEYILHATTTESQRHNYSLIGDMLLTAALGMIEGQDVEQIGSLSTQ